MSLRAVIFDFDFTLVDSSRGFIECHDYACRALSLPPVAAESAMAMMGTPLHEAFRVLFPGESSETAREYVRFWQARADEVMTDLTHVFASVPPALLSLRRLGLGLGIVSQKLRHRIEAVLKREGIEGAFGVVVGGDDTRAFKPDPEGILLAAERLAVPLGEALYVGDTVIDAQAAANAGVPFVAVLSGVTPADAFGRHAVAAVLDDVADLVEICRRWS